MGLDRLLSDYKSFPWREAFFRRLLIMYPRDFRIKLFILELRIDSLFGTVGHDGTLYFSAIDVASILGNPDSWIEKVKTCRYQDIGFKTSKRNQCPMIERDELKPFLKPFVTYQKEARFLYGLLFGCQNIRYEKVMEKEHIMICCPCSFYQGIMFKVWVRHHRATLFLCESKVILTPRPHWNGYHNGVKYAPDFRVKLYLEEDRIDSLFGTISQEGEIYFSSYNIAMFLHKQNPIRWSKDIQTCYYQDIEHYKNSNRKHFRMIRSKELVTLLKEEKNCPTEAQYLLDLLCGRKKVKYEDIMYREHVMNCCKCGQFYGISLDDWLWKHKSHLLQKDSISYSPRTKV